MKQYIIIALLWAMSLQAGLAELNNAPLQAVPVQMFIRLLSDVRSATPQSGAAKAEALRLFNQLYESGSHEVHELLETFVSNLQRLLDHRLMFTKNKERQVIMLLEESKHLLIEISSHTAGINNKDICEQLMHQLYIALNPTLGDHWRQWRTLSGSLVGGILGVLGLVVCWKLYHGIKRVNNQEGQWGELIKSFNQIVNYSMQEPVVGEVYLGEQVARTLQTLQNRVNLRDPAQLQQLMETGTHLEQLVATFSYLMLTDAHARANGNNERSIGERWATILEHTIDDSKDSLLRRHLPDIAHFLGSLGRETDQELSMTLEQRASARRTQGYLWAATVHALVTGTSQVTTPQLINALSEVVRRFFGAPEGS